MTRSVFRNVVILVGAYYVSILVGMPFFLLFAKIHEGHVYYGEGGSLLGGLVSTIPVAIDSILSGLMAGWLVQSKAPARWAWGLAGFLFVASLSSHHWKIVPTAMDRIGEILEATLVGLIAVPAFLFASRRRAPEAGGD